MRAANRRTLEQVAETRTAADLLRDRAGVDVTAVEESRARRVLRPAQSPSACFRSSAREVSSHVKSFSDRPKWP